MGFDNNFCFEVNCSVAFEIRSHQQFFQVLYDGQHKKNVYTHFQSLVIGFEIHFSAVQGSMKNTLSLFIFQHSISSMTDLGLTVKTTLALITFTTECR